MAVFSLLFNINSILLSRQTYKPSLKFLVLFLSPVLIRELNGREKDENRKRRQSEEPFEVDAEQQRGGSGPLPPPRPRWCAVWLGEGPGGGGSVWGWGALRLCSSITWP